MSESLIANAKMSTADSSGDLLWTLDKQGKTHFFHVLLLGQHFLLLGQQTFLGEKDEGAAFNDLKTLQLEVRTRLPASEDVFDPPSLSWDV